MTVEGSPFVACSACFRDFGFGRVAVGLGEESSEACPECGSTEGRKLTDEHLDEVCQEFLVKGSIPPGIGTFAPVIQFNRLRTDFDLFGSEDLRADISLLNRLGVRPFFYGPPFWYFGKVPDDGGKVVWRKRDFDFVLDHCIPRQIEPPQVLYRSQCSVAPADLKPARFCSPPDVVRKRYGRFDSRALPVWYGSLDVETCLHESRVTLKDDTFVAVCRPARALSVLDLTQMRAPIDYDPFDDPRLWLQVLLYRGTDTYGVCRRLAKVIRDRGYDGFIFTSYFQQVAERSHVNVALFGRPVVDGRLEVLSINTARLRNVAYDWQFGPAI